MGTSRAVTDTQLPELMGAVLIIDAGTLSSSAAVSDPDRPDLYGAQLIIDAGTLSSSAGTVDPGDEPELYGAQLIIDAGTLSSSAAVSDPDEPHLYGAQLVIEMNQAPGADNVPNLYGAQLIIDAGSLSQQGENIDLPRLYGAQLIIDGGKAFWSPNRVRDPDWFHKPWTRSSDLIQLVNNQSFVHDTFGNDHSTTTGQHSNTKDFTAWVSSGTAPALADTQITNTLDDTASADTKTGTTQRTDPSTASAPGTDFPQLSNDLTGVVPGCKGADSGGGEAEAVAAVKANGGNTDLVTIMVRRATGSAASDFSPLSVYSQDAALQLGEAAYTHTTAGSRGTIPVVRDQVNASGMGFTRNHYDRYYRNTESIYDAIRYRHTAGTWASETITLEEFHGGSYVDIGSASYASTSEFTQLGSYAHGGAYFHLIPTLAGFSTTNEVAACAAYDDTNAYLYAWYHPGLAWSGTGRGYFGYCPVKLAAPSNASLSGTFDHSYKSGPLAGIDTDDTDQLDTNESHLSTLWTVEHEATTGRHQLGLDKFSGYSLVVNAASVTAPGTVGDYTSGTIEAWPGTDPIYFIAAVGAAGSGIVKFTVGGDETNAKWYAQRITAGSSNSFTLTVIRINRA